MTLPLASVGTTGKSEADAKPSLTEGARCSLAFAAGRVCLQIKSAHIGDAIRPGVVP